MFLVGSYNGSIDFGGGKLLASSGGDTDLFVARLDQTTGEHVWSQGFGDAQANQSPTSRNSIAVTNGRLVVAGDFLGTLDFGSGPMKSAGAEDIYLAHFDPAGGLVFARSFGDTGSDILGSVAVDSAGGITMVGHFHGTTTFGQSTSVSAGGYDAFFAKYLATSAPVWVHSFGDASDQRAYSVALDYQGNALITGEFSGTINFGGTPLLGPGMYLVKESP